MSLLDLLLNEPSIAERAMGVMQMSQPSGPTTPGPGRVRPAGAPVAGGTSAYSGSLAPHELALQAARKIERRPGFEVAGLTGWEGQGPISSGHIEGSQHYGPGFAGDVNYVGGGRFPNETQALSWLENWLQQKYGDRLTELIWQEPDHYDHLHYGTRPGG